MLKRKYNSFLLADIPLDVLTLIVSYSPRDFLLISKKFCGVVRGLRREISVFKALKLNLKSKLIAEVIFNSPNIHTLDVSGWSYFDNSFIEYMSKLTRFGHYRNLNHLYVSNCHKAAKPIRVLLGHLKHHLQTLDLFNCRGISTSTINHHFSELRALLLGYKRPYNIQVNGFNDILKNVFGISNGDHGKIKFPKLNVLQLYNLTEIKSLSPLVNISSTLRILDIRGCAGIMQSDLSVISKFRNLEELHIDNKKIVEKCNKLSIIDLSSCLISLDIIDSIIEHLPLLKRLKLTKCSSLTNDAIKTLITNLANLNVLDISYCWRITNSFSQTISNVASGNNLERIGIFMCSLDPYVLVHNFNMAGAKKVMAVTHYELQIISNKLHIC